MSRGADDSVSHGICESCSTGYLLVHNVQPSASAEGRDLYPSCPTDSMSLDR